MEVTNHPKLGNVPAVCADHYGAADKGDFKWCFVPKDASCPNLPYTSSSLPNVGWTLCKNETVAPGCVNSLDYWEDYVGYTCEAYELYGWCTNTGGYGIGWMSHWGDFQDYTWLGHHAGTACCACGGGRVTTTSTTLTSTTSTRLTSTSSTRTTSTSTQPPTTTTTIVTTAEKTPPIQAFSATTPDQVIAMRLTVNNVDYAVLSSLPSTHALFGDAVAAGLVTEAGNGIMIEHVRVTLAAGSVVAQSSISIPLGAGISAVAVQTALASSSTLGQTIINSLQSVPGLPAAMTGPLSVTGITKPQLDGEYLPAVATSSGTTAIATLQPSPDTTEAPETTLASALPVTASTSITVAPTTTTMITSTKTATTSAAATTLTEAAATVGATTVTATGAATSTAAITTTSTATSTTASLVTTTSAATTAAVAATASSSQTSKTSTTTSIMGMVSSTSVTNTDIEGSTYSASSTSTITTSIISSTSTKALPNTTRTQKITRLVMMPTEADSPQTSPQLEEQDWDALEFSPVYQCLEKGWFYNQLSSSCISECPAAADLAHGQCVLPNVSTSSASYTGLWRLQTHCGTECWKDKAEVSVHFVRLSMADHLDIPFQEVGDVLLRSARIKESRRLSTTGAQPIKEAFLDISITSRRLAEIPVLSTFLTNAAAASQLLGFAIHSVEFLPDIDAKVAREYMSDEPVPGEKDDAYGTFYDDIAPVQPGRRQSNRGITIGAVVSDGIPAALIIAIAGAIAGFAVLAALYFRYRGWKRLRDEKYLVTARIVKGKGQAEDEAFDEDPKAAVKGDHAMKLNRDYELDPEAMAKAEAQQNVKNGDADPVTVKAALKVGYQPNIVQLDDDLDFIKTAMKASQQGFTELREPEEHSVKINIDDDVIPTKKPSVPGPRRAADPSPSAACVSTAEEQEEDVRVKVVQSQGVDIQDVVITTTPQTVGKLIQL